MEPRQPEYVVLMAPVWGAVPALSKTSWSPRFSMVSSTW
jgi:hypothetical protein